MSLLFCLIHQRMQQSRLLHNAIMHRCRPIGLSLPLTLTFFLVWLPGPQAKILAHEQLTDQPTALAVTAPTPDYYYNFNEGSGTLASNSGAESGFDGTLLNGASWTPGILSTALLFTDDGGGVSQDRVQIGKSNGGSNWTVAVWLRRDTDANNAFPAMITTGQVGAGLGAESDNAASKVIGYTDNDVAVSSYHLPIGHWHHLTFVGSGSQIKLYVDGDFYETLNYSGNTTFYLWGIGDDDDGNITSFIGAIDEFKAWKTLALSAAEVSELYNAYRELSLGNRVWRDLNDNAVEDVGESGIANVKLELLDEFASPTGEIAITDGDGYYVFESLAPGSYRAQLSALNFAAGQPLEGLLSGLDSDQSALPDLNRDGDDNGIYKGPTGEIYSEIIVLTAGQEPTGESHSGSVSNDSNANFTLDFGVSLPRVRLVHVDPTTDQITLQNFDSETIDVTGFRLCSEFNCTANLTDVVSVVVGSLLIAPGETVTLTGFPLDATGADLGFYMPQGDFSAPHAMLDFVQWGSAGNGYESVAQTKGIWTQGDFISAAAPFEYNGNGEQSGVLFWSGQTSLDALDDTHITPRNASTIINVLQNDSGTNLAVTILQQPTHGTATVNGNNTINYTPNTDYVGLDTLTYQLANGTETDIALVTIIVNDPTTNSPPDARNDTARVLQNSFTLINVLKNDLDDDGDLLTVSILVPPVHGTAIVQSDGSIKYIASGSYSGLDTLRYKIDDGHGHMDSAIVKITVDTPQNNDPSTVDDVAIVMQNGHKVINVLANDSDSDGDPLTVSLLLPPLHGTATVNGNNAIIYTPNAGYAGPDSLIYQVTDGNGGVSASAIFITVDPPQNNDPNAVNDTVIALANSSNTFTVLANDSDADGHPLLVLVTTAPLHGTATVNASGSIVYTPNPGYSGVDSLIYRLEDGHGGEDTAIVHIVVDGPGNDAPQAADDTTTTTQEQSATIAVLTNDIDTDGDPLTIAIVTPPAHGATIINPDGTVTYAPTGDYAGTDSFVYLIDDGNGGQDSATVSITIGARAYNCNNISDVSLAECQALVELYRVTDGPHWGIDTNWLTTNDACTWFGITCQPAVATQASAAQANAVQESATQTIAADKVTRVELPNNNLTGELPCVLENLFGITLLDLNGNQLSGLMPCELSKLNALTHLDLSNNQLSDGIPRSLGDLPEIQNLYLNNNLFSGQIPAALGNATSLLRLRLGGNQLSGNIPPELGNLANLIELTLNSNRLMGDVPAPLTGLTALASLDIGYNGLVANGTTATFLNAVDPDWANTQTVPPSGLQVVGSTGPSFLLTWTPIAYTADGGSYQIEVATEPNGPFTQLGTTADKSASSYVASGLSYDTRYYFRISTFTPVHAGQINALTSDYSDIVAGSVATPTPTPPPTTAPPPTPTPVPAAYDLSVQNVEFTQAIQTTSNSVPLVAGKPVVARLTIGVSGISSAVNNVTARLRAYRDGTELPDSPLAPFNSGGVITAQLVPDRSQLNHTLNFAFPTSWLSAGDLVIQAVVNPGLTDQNNSNNSQSYTVPLHSMPNLEIVLVPIAFQPGGTGPIYRPTLDGSTGYGLGYIKELYPITDVSYTIHPELHFTGDLYTLQGWSNLLNAVKAMRNNEVSNPSATMPKYYGVVQVAPGCCIDQGWPVSPASAVGGYGNNPGGAAVGLEASIYDFSNGGRITNVEHHMASHEIGHTLGIFHAPCNVSGDPNFPQANGSIGDIGLYIPEMKLLASSYSDVMSYCINVSDTPSMWISAYHYTKLFTALSGLPASSAPTVAPQGFSLAAVSTQTGWLASGIIGPTGVTGTLESAFTIAEAPVDSNTQTCETHELRLVDDNGSSLFSHHFSPEPQHDEDGSGIGNPNDNSTAPGSGGAPTHSQQSYGVVLPKISGTARIQLWSGNHFLDECTVSSAPPTLTAGFSDNGTSISLNWSAADPNSSRAPWVAIRYSADGGTTWAMIDPRRPNNDTLTIAKGQLPQSANGLFEVIASTCTESTTQQVTVGNIGNTAPRPAILGETVKTFSANQAIILKGVATDLEDGSLPGSSLQWTNDQIGNIGSGGQIVIANGIAAGRYTMTLTAADSQGLAAQTSVTLVINSDDTDGDGIEDVIEDAGPNGGDGNGDSVLDSQQSDVASLQLLNNNGYVTAEVGGDCNQITQIANTFEADQQVGSGPYDTLYDYPYGLMGLTLQCGAPGQSADVTYYWHVPVIEPLASFRKFGPTVPGDALHDWYTYPAIQGSRTVGGAAVLTTMLTLTDGQLGDATVADGVIQDPGGPVGPVQASLQVSKVLNTIEPVRVGQTVSFTIRITNTGGVTITMLPLEDRFNHAFLTYDSASTSPLTVTAGVLQWDNLAPVAGLVPSGTISVDIFFTTRADTTLLLALPPCTQNNEVPNIARVAKAQAGAIAIVEDADDTACASVQILKPTSVILSNQEIQQTSAGVLVRWTTINESDLSGFFIWHSNGVTVQQRNEQMIVAKNAGQAMANGYEWLDAGATLMRGDTYVLEVLKNDGSSERLIIGVMSGGSIYLPLLEK